jgi:hypothetical protein
MISFAASSAEYTGMPSREKIFATVVLPEPMPPVMPMICLLQQNKQKKREGNVPFSPE